MSQLYGHAFVPHKSEERICWGCGYVTPRDREPIEFMAEQNGGMVETCSGQWHVNGRKVPYAAALIKEAP